MKYTAKYVWPFLITVVLFGTMAFQNNTASAATLSKSVKSVLATCAYPNCHLKDPNSTGCATNSVVLATRDAKKNGVTTVRVELRYSPTCKTVWARGIKFTNVYPYPYVELTAGDGNKWRFISDKWGVSGQKYTWTKMSNTTGYPDPRFRAFAGVNNDKGPQFADGYYIQTDLVIPPIP